ncbi:MAG: hypothetical protein FWE09_04855 [Treponema sp.]|nr:hypothetical protein [Treponema sp.]
MRRFCLFVFSLAFIAGAAFSQTAASQTTRFVAAESAEIRASAWGLARSLGTLRFGDEVALLRESGSWSEVRAGNVVGWVASASLGARRRTAAGAAATPGQVALAGKGFDGSLEELYRLDGLDFSPVDAVEALVVPRDALLDFIIDGGLSRVAE